MTPEVSQMLTAVVDRVPAFPRSLQQIIALSHDVNCAPKDCVRVIENDPLVAVKILRVVNSCQWRLGQWGLYFVPATTR